MVDGVTTSVASPPAPSAIHLPPSANFGRRLTVRQALVWTAALITAAAPAAAFAGERPPTDFPAMPSTAPQRTEAVQVWVCQPPKDLTAFDVPAPGQKLEINLIAPRGGRANGQVVLASAKPIRGVKAAVSDLSVDGAKGTIPAKQILVRFPAVAEPYRDNAPWVPDNRFDVLLPEVPAEVPTRSVRTGFHRQKFSDPLVPVGAMQPVWLTVLVPADAVPGTYRGELTVSAEGLAPTRIPLGIKVYGWTLPDPKDFTCRTNIWQSHDSVALRYGVPLWSDRHLELMGQVLELTKPMGNGFCPVHLIAGAFNMDNAESMVRWIDKGDGKYEYDFAPFDKYLDLYEKKLGKPRVLLLSVFRAGADGGNMKGALPAMTTGENPVKVSRLDPATGKVEPMTQPLYGTEASAEFWKPILAEVSKRLEKRGSTGSPPGALSSSKGGWLDVAAIGTGSDAFPTKETVSAFLKAAPDFKWFSTSHKNPSYYPTSDGKRVPVPFREHVWGVGEPRKPEYGMPWKAGGTGGVWVFSRYGAGACTLRQFDCLFGHRFNPEITLHTGWAGLGQSGADFWNVPGRKRPLCSGPGEGVGLGISILSFTAPGPTSPLATERLEMVAEGMQVVEALAILLKAVDEKKLDAALAAKCQEQLAKRAARNLEIMPKGPGKGPPGPAANYFPSWQEDDETLFALCAEVSARLGGK